MTQCRGRKWKGKGSRQEGRIREKRNCKKDEQEGKKLMKNGGRKHVLMNRERGEGGEKGREKERKEGTYEGTCNANKGDVHCQEH